MDAIHARAEIHFGQPGFQTIFFYPISKGKWIFRRGGENISVKQESWREDSLKTRSTKVTSQYCTFHKFWELVLFFLSSVWLQVGDGGIIVLDATLDASTTDDAEWELSGGPPSPCDVSFCNDNVLINGRSNLSRTPRNHKVNDRFISSYYYCTFCCLFIFNVIRLFIAVNNRSMFIFNLDKERWRMQKSFSFLYSTVLRNL